MPFLFASYFPPPYLLLLLFFFGVPSVLWGALMTLSGIYEQRQARRDERQESSATDKLGIGVALIVLGIVLLGTLAATIALTT